MKILFETDSYWIVEKPSGLVSEASGGRGLADRLAEANGGYAGVIHRLDREVSGVMIYAKTPEAAAHFSELSRTHALEKEYLAAVAGTPEESAGELRDLLFYDRAKNKAFRVDRRRAGVKEAILQYQLEKTGVADGIGPVSVMRIKLLTGRTHQIRVQFASRGHAVIGDRRYGGPALPAGLAGGRILLSCRKISFPEGDGVKEFCKEPDWLSLF